MSAGVNLQPEAILQVAVETEERVWSQGGIADDCEDSLRHDPADMGMCVLMHGTSTKQIHNYFTGLEQRKCCLLLAACKQRFASVRLVRNDGRDSGIEEGAMMKSSVGNNDSVPGLDAVEFQVFKNALKCAAFPVLGAPEPPSESTPVPEHRTPTRLGPSPRRRKNELVGTLLNLRNLSPASMHDSGVEEQEDSALVPTETLCELLRRSFKLTQEKFNHYEKIVIAHIDKKSPQKVLAEELSLQLIALENNDNPYYNPKAFMNRTGYDQWQQKERTHITDLLNKFWHCSLPTPSDRSAKMSLLHKQYRQLMEKLISYESPYRQHTELIAPPPTSPLSTASVRLLKEFGLRYGVGEQYRKIVYLNYLSLNFDPTVWFIHHVMMTLTYVMEAMPTKRSSLVIVKEELSILEESLQLLEAKSSAVIAKMKTLYSQTSTRPLDGVEPLIELLSLTLKAKTYLVMCPEEQLGTRLYKIAQAIFPTAYERHKMVAQDELRHNKWDTELSPKLLNMQIGHIRDEVQDYKQNYQSAFLRYFNITVEAAQEFYKLLMADVAELLKQTKNIKRQPLEINKLMLSLAYRLHQLDQDWTHYINPQMQTWRDLFLVEAQHWSGVLKVDMQTFITHAVSLDRYPVCELQWSGSLQSSSGRSVRHRAGSKSLTPSLNSAFTSPSSAQSTPNIGQGHMFQPPTVREEPRSLSPDPSNVPEFPVQYDSSPSMGHRSPLQEQRPCSDPVNVSQRSLLNGSYIGDVARSLGHCDEDELLSFGRLRHSSSLPNIVGHAKYYELVPRTRPENTNKQISQKATHSNTTGDKVWHDNSFSPEVSGLTSQRLHGDHDSDNSDTITDDSGSHNDDISYPLLEEMPSSNSANIVGTAPLTVIAEITPNSSMLRPVAREGHSSAIEIQRSNQNSYTKSVITESTSRGLESAQTAQDTPHTPKKVPPMKKPTVYEDLHHQSQPHHDSFTDSIGSNISFPHPQGFHDVTKATLPISSSAIDIVTILQRIVGMGKVLCRTLTPAHHGYDSDQSAFSSSREDNFHIPQMFAKPRQKLYDSFLSGIKHTVMVYTDNMLCMDLCGTTQTIAKRLAGTRLIEYLQTQQRGGLIWGCRHDQARNKDCFQYLDKQTSFLCDRHEPITRRMCTRINNVMFMSACLDWYYRYLGNAFGVFGEMSVRQTRKYLHSSINSSDILKSDFIVVDNFDYDPSGDRSEVMETASQLCPSQHSSDGEIRVTSPIDGEKDHLMAVMRAMCRIMAYRLNLFVCDALPVLLTLKGVSVPIEQGLSPITDFLSNYTGALKGWLYKDSFRRVLECLWIFIVQDFEQELHKMETANMDTMNQGRLLLQALAHLLKFMNNQHESLRRDLLLSQADDVSFKLSLYAMPLQQLVAIYRGLCKDAASSETSSTDTQFQSVLMVRQRLKHDLQTYRKGFSGAELVHWILDNLELFSSFDPGLSDTQVMYKREKARNIAQRLLDWRVVADIEGETVVGRGSPTGSLTAFEFPDMTIHAQLSSQTDGDSDEDNTPQATPRATPKPTGLRASIRALSRQKTDTPGFTSRLGEKSQFVQSLKSQTGSQKEKESQQGKSLLRHNYYGQQSVVASSRVKEISEQEGTMADDPGRTSPVRNEGLVTSGPMSIDSEYSGDKFVFTGPGFGALGRQDSDNGSLDFDPYINSMRGSPNSITSGMSCESRSAIFFESSDTFYCVCPYIGDEKQLNWKNYELFNLVEECFQKKVTEDYLLRIIYSRRKTDPRAKKFLQSSPVKVREMIRFGGPNEEASVCTSS